MRQQHREKQLVIYTQRSKARDRRLSTNGGFTLVELMIAIVIGMIIIGATYATYISQQRSFVAQDQVAEMNTTSKIALDMIANDIREAGFGLPEGGTFNINGFTSIINFTDKTDAPDTITILGGFRKAGTLCSNSSGEAIKADDTQVNIKPPSGATTLKDINTTDKKNISINGISFDIVKTGGGSTMTIELQNPVGKTYPKYTDQNGNGKCDDGEGVPVYVIEDITYQVVGTDLQRVRRLNGGSPDIDVIAQNIEDLQFAMVDINGDGITDRIRVNILARTARPDPNFQGQGNPPATIENRNHTPTNDSYRRRWWQMEVDLRNPI